MSLADCAPSRDSDKHDALMDYGPGIVVSVGPPTPTDPKKTDHPQQHLALIDTGASESCIDESWASELGLPVVSKTTVGGIAGMGEHDVYLAVINVPGVESVQYGEFSGVNLAGSGLPHRVLLGRDFLAGSLLIYDGVRAQVTLAT